MEKENIKIELDKLYKERAEIINELDNISDFINKLEKCLQE